MPAIFAQLKEAKIDFRCDSNHPIHHNKVAIIDGKTIVTGSFNFSPSADHNAENTNVIRNVPELAKEYKDIWDSHWMHSK